MYTVALFTWQKNHIQTIFLFISSLKLLCRICRAHSQSAEQDGGPYKTVSCRKHTEANMIVFDEN